MAPELKIDSTTVSYSHKPYIIAEAGSNFDQNFTTALKLIDVAAASGANCVKFQLFRAEALYPGGGEMFDIFKSIELNPDWIPKLRSHANDQDLHFTASAFDAMSLGFLEDVGVPLHKVASSETTNLKILQTIAASGKPTIISTGMCDMVDIQEAVNIFENAGNDQFALLQCNAVYPLDTKDSNVSVIQNFAKRFDCVVGFSDHTTSTNAALAAVGLGGRVFEKHFTLSKEGDGPDHIYAMEPAELKNYVAAIHDVFSAIGVNKKDMLPSERAEGRRDGLYFAHNRAKGHIITADDFTIARPAQGLRSRYSDLVLGAKLSKDAVKGNPIFMTDLDL